MLGDPDRTAPPPAASWPAGIPLLAFSLGGLLVGAVARLNALAQLADAAWGAVCVVLLVALTLTIARKLRAGEAGVDILAALALTGAMLLGEYLAGAVIGLMLATGTALEGYAAVRAERGLRTLVARAPRIAHRYDGSTIAALAVDEVGVGDRLLVKSGEVVPVDGIVVGGAAVLDESALTGEAEPATRHDGEPVQSGALNAGAPFDLYASATAAASTYAGIIRLVRAAHAVRAPFTRLADRYALALVPITLIVAAGAWVVSGEASRALAVLVVATPCPLILAVPVAMVSGISAAARRGVLIKGSPALESLANARVVLLDKTGTLTRGQAKLVDVRTADGVDAATVLHAAASLDQMSQHVIATAVVGAAHARGQGLTLPTDVREVPGAGVTGRVGDRRVALGSLTYATGDRALPAWASHVAQRARLEGQSAVFVAIDDTLAGALLLDDHVRSDAPSALRALRELGMKRIVMLSGDRQDVAETVATALDFDAVLAERSPEDKVEAVLAERAHGTTVMVGDGINDAAALATADVGVAMGARGIGASSEAADVVLMVDRLDRLTDGIRIARHAKGVAVQSVALGMTLTGAAMGFAAAGLLVPVAGALVQELIDVLAIANALRALGTRRALGPARGIAPETARKFAREHRELEPVLDELRATADQLDALAPPDARAAATRVASLLREHITPHEHVDEAEVYPVIAHLLGGRDPMGSLSRVHREIHHLCRLYERLVGCMSVDGPSAEERRDMRRVLYGLEAILRLHYAQEEELYETIADEAAADARSAADG